MPTPPFAPSPTTPTLTKPRTPSGILDFCPGFWTNAGCDHTSKKSGRPCPPALHNRPSKLQKIQLNTFVDKTKTFAGHLTGGQTTTSAHHALASPPVCRDFFLRAGTRGGIFSHGPPSFGPRPGSSHRAPVSPPPPLPLPAPVPSSTRAFFGSRSSRSNVRSLGASFIGFSPLSSDQLDSSPCPAPSPGSNPFGGPHLLFPSPRSSRPRRSPIQATSPVSSGQVVDSPILVSSPGSNPVGGPPLVAPPARSSRLGAKSSVSSGQVNDSPTLVSSPGSSPLAGPPLVVSATVKATPSSVPLPTTPTRAPAPSQALRPISAARGPSLRSTTPQLWYHRLAPISPASHISWHRPHAAVGLTQSHPSAAVSSSLIQLWRRRLAPISPAVHLLWPRPHAAVGSAQSRPSAAVSSPLIKFWRRRLAAISLATSSATGLRHSVLAPAALIVRPCPPPPLPAPVPSSTRAFSALGPVGATCGLSALPS